MPREPVDKRARPRTGNVMGANKSPMKIPLNDDRKEKAARLQSRQALQEIQLNQIKAAAASPMKKRKSLNASDMGSPSTPRRGNNDSHGSPGMAIVGGNSTPMKRVPILANFEEWMKMATDNKINATNSWNFALIDYFHDMSLLREGDSVNFQKASCTLDGCVKIYTSRVDSVATETGKLLSGLADSKGKKGDGKNDAGGDDEEGGDEDEEGEDGVKKRTKKRAQRSSEATLATSFAQLQLKKMELEFSVDPLFKKASADFDEGGAKGLLLNHLTIDAEGRIVFDSSDDVENMLEQIDEDVPEPEEELDHDIKDTILLNGSSEADTAEQSVDLDIELLRQKFFPDIGVLDEQEICAPLKTFELDGSDDAMDIPFLKASDERKGSDAANELESALGEDADGAGGFGDDDDDGALLGSLEGGEGIGFGEGGEAWAKEAALSTQPRTWTSQPEEMDGEDGAELVEGETGPKQYGILLTHGQAQDQENILKYFDQALSKNWAGPEHWRIRKIKDSTKPQQPTTKRKEREPFEIDFLAPMSKQLSDTLYTAAATSSAISLPKAQWKSRTRNLLPDDKHFNSRQLLSLFLKPKARIGHRRTGQSGKRLRQQDVQEEMDEAYWARNQMAQDAPDMDDTLVQGAGNYDANFFQDDGLGLPAGLGDEEGDEFADARETFSPGLDGVDQVALGSLNEINASSEQGFGSQLVTQSRRLRPEYVQYARVAKKVDVRRLKEEMWRGMGFQDAIDDPTIKAEAKDDPMEIQQEPLKFTAIMNGLQSVYPSQAMADISTSYCFISLLHLANEKGLILENDQTFEEISVQRDLTAEITAEG